MVISISVSTSSADVAPLNHDVCLLQELGEQAFLKCLFLSFPLFLALLLLTSAP